MYIINLLESTSSVPWYVLGFITKSCARFFLPILLSCRSLSIHPTSIVARGDYRNSRGIFNEIYHSWLYGCVGERHENTLTRHWRQFYISKILARITMRILARPFVSHSLLERYRRNKSRLVSNNEIRKNRDCVSYFLLKSPNNNLEASYIVFFHFHMLLNHIIFSVKVFHFNQTTLFRRDFYICQKTMQCCESIWTKVKVK